MAKNVVHPQMIAFLESIFPDKPGKETFDQISKHGKKTKEEIEDFIEKKGR